MSNKFIPACIMMVLIFAACNQPDTQQLEARIDSLQKKVDQSYRPGLGEFMSNIQVHHAKLWFAGKNENWQLADFEIHEIMESVGDIQQYDTDRKESKDVIILSPALDSLNQAIQQKDTAAFRKRFIVLTNTCNDCHRDVNYDFNHVKIPDTPPFSNQVFKIAK